MCRSLIFLATLMLAPLPAYADVVWPALYLERRMFSWWDIGLGIGVEFVFIRKVFVLSYQRALLADLAANAASALLGALMIPLVGIVWEVFPGLVLYYFLNMGTFNPITWGATCIFASLINAGIEGFILKCFFRLPLTREIFYWLTLINSFSVAIAFISLWWIPTQ